MCYRFPLSSAVQHCVDIRWLFGGHSEEVVVMSNHGTVVVLPAYQQKASNVPNAGIALRQVTPSDTDNGA